MRLIDADRLLDEIDKDIWKHKYTSLNVRRYIEIIKNECTAVDRNTIIELLKKEYIKYWEIGDADALIKIGKENPILIETIFTEEKYKMQVNCLHRLDKLYDIAKAEERLEKARKEYEDAIMYLRHKNS